MKPTNNLNSHSGESRVRRFDKMGKSEWLKGFGQRSNSRYRKFLKKFSVSKMRMAMRNKTFDKI